MPDDASTVPFILPPVSTVCSRTLWLYLSDYKSSLDFFQFVVRLATVADTTAVAAAKALMTVGPNSDDKRAELQETIDNPDRAFKKLRSYSGINSKNIAVATADGFLWLISNVTQSAIKRRPELLKSGESIRVEDILEFESKRELINYLVDRKVNALSFGGMKQIEKFVLDYLGIEVFATDRDRAKMRTLIEIRNIYAHNRGVVNHVFLDRVRGLDDLTGMSFALGQSVHLDFDTLMSFSEVALQTAISLDQQVSRKFGIRMKRISSWIASEQ